MTPTPYQPLLTKIKKNLGETAVMDLVNTLIQDALSLRASDVHFEPYENTYRVRIRIDGLLSLLTELPLDLAPTLTSRLKIMAHLDIAERRLPQDGRFGFSTGNNTNIDFRISTCPSAFGEKVVLRFLDTQQTQVGIDVLGLSSLQKQQVLNALRQPQGMMIVTGPTGSGKTVTLYTALSVLNTPERNISTVEDPIEIHLAGVNQLPLNPKIGLTFASALRAFLRQDPDVLMVGEIRDLETAEMAIKAAQTGHLVLSTLHTNSALATVERLQHMGLPTYTVAHALTLIIAQRLARRLCEHCKTPETLSTQTLLEQGFSAEQLANSPPTLYQARGCNACHHGYHGRIGLFEVLPITRELQQLMIANAPLQTLLQQAQQQGFQPLCSVGLDKVSQGITSLAELQRVLGGSA